MTIRLLLQLVFLFLTIAAQVASGGHFADENGNEQIIETTDLHPFWVVSESGSGYVDAKDLQIGDTFLGTNGELSTLVEKKRVEYPAGITVYNFTVDGNHDYFVIAQTAEFGQTCILVHNACNLPSIKKLQINIDHITSGHVAGGSRISANSTKTIFPSNWSENKIINAIKEAYANAKKIQTQLVNNETKIKLRGTSSDGMLIEMWVNVTTCELETAYPINVKLVP
jgi:hypothetical protein